MPSSESFPFAALAMGQSIAQFQAYMPPLADVRKASPEDASMRGDVRAGEVASLVGSLLVGVIIAYMTGDPTGALISVMVCAVFIAMYEYMLRATRPLEN